MAQGGGRRQGTRGANLRVKLKMSYSEIANGANKKIKVTREFDAPLDKVWKAWTEQELLDQWWAPLPWTSKTIKMDFRNGGALQIHPI